MLASPAAVFAGLAEPVGQRSVCGGADALVWALLCLLRYLSAVCWHGAFATPPVPLPGVVSPLCATRWKNRGKRSPSVDKNSHPGVYTARLHTHAPCAPHSRGRAASLPSGSRGPAARASSAPPSRHQEPTNGSFAAATPRAAGWGAPGIRSRSQGTVPNTHLAPTHAPGAAGTAGPPRRRSGLWAAPRG